MSTQNIAQNTIAKLVLKPGGTSLSEAVAAAESNLDTIRDRMLGEVSTTIARMDTLGHAILRHPDPVAIDELYRLGNTVVGIAGVFGMGSLGQVAYSLCDLIDRLRSRSTWDASAVKVHMDSLRLLQSPGPAVDPEAVVAALRRVVDRF